MTLARQQALVQDWSTSAAAWNAKRLEHRVAMHEWTQDRFASPWMLAWAFAAGAWVGAGRHDSADERRPTKKYVGLANTVLLAWRLLG